MEQPILWWGGRDGDAGIEVGCKVCVVEAYIRKMAKLIRRLKKRLAVLAGLRRNF